MSPSSHRKHVDVVETSRNGKLTYRLLSQDQALCEFFDAWAYQLASRLKYKTVRTYCYAVKAFLNYVEEAKHQRGSLTTELIWEILESYESFLVFGKNSDSELSSSIAWAIGEKNLSGASVETHFAAINRFIDASENLRVGLIDLTRNGYLTGQPISSMPLMASSYQAAAIYVKSAIKSNSWLAGCIAGGARQIKRAGLSPKSKASVVAYTDEFGGDDSAFPIDRCVDLIRSTNCLRDKTLWSLIAASGCRISEALTIQLDDIHIDTKSRNNNKVLIVDPARRKNVLIEHVPAKAIEKMAHKGRETPATFLIEPFASIFWDCLDSYVESERSKERMRHRPVRHRFLFRNLRTGEPMPLSYQAVWERFNRAALKITGKNYGFHSLRHMYAYYLRNYCPNPEGIDRFGFDDHQVKTFLGHRDINTTQRYARQDAKLLEATLAAANMLRMRDPSFSSTNVAIQHLEGQLANLRKTVGEACNG